MQRCWVLLLTFALAALSSCIITASAGSELPPDWQLESGLLPLNSLSGDIVSGPAAPADVDAAAIRKQEAVLTDHGTDTTQGITFECAGSSKCGGMLYLPKKKPATAAQKATNSSTSSAKLPIVVLAHGLGGEKTWLAKFAGVFAGKGIAALTFDYRHWGSSDGTPRQWISVTKQHEDWQAAVKHVQTTQLGGLVDPSRLCLWGTSYGGGHVIFVASKLGSQVKCVISNVPHLAGGKATRGNAAMRGTKGNALLTMAALKDLAADTAGSAPVYIPLAGPVGSAALMQLDEHDMSVYSAAHTHSVAGNWRNLTRARFATEQALTQYSPIDVVDKVQAPLLLIAGTKDRLCPFESAVAAVAKAPHGTLVKFDVGHFDPYVQPTLGLSLQKQVPFLKQHLGV